MTYFEFFWNDETLEHLDEHGVSREDFEAIVRSPDEVGESESPHRPCCWGSTPDGRYLFCVFEQIDDITILPITAYEVRRPGE